MKILSITSFKKKYQNTVVAVVELDNGEKLLLQPETVLTFDLHAFDTIDTSRLDDLRAFDTSGQCRTVALNLLSIRPRSTEELRSRLRQKKFSPATIDTCLSELSAKGYLDDADFAIRYARARLQKKPIGEKALRFELRKKGIRGDLIEQAMREVYGEDTALTMALAAAKKKLATYKKTEPAKIRQKLFLFLSQRGFSQNVIREVFKQLNFGRGEDNE